MFVLFIPLLRKLVSRFIKFTLQLGARRDVKPGRYVAEPPTPFNKAILDCLGLTPQPYTPEEVNRIASDPSEYSELKDLLEPYVINDALFVM